MRKAIIACLFLIPSAAAVWAGQVPDDSDKSPGSVWTSGHLADNAPPVVSDIPDQAIFVGDSFVQIPLDAHVEDAEDPDSLISWDFYSDDADLDLSVSLLDRIATITMPDPYWYGSDTITFTATDTGGLADSSSVVFTSIIEFRYTPDDTMISMGDTASLSIWIDHPIDVRTFELFVEYDPSILTGIEGRAGQLFDDTGAFIWEDYEEESPGHWHGYAVVMGAGVWATGPGELFVWDFVGSNGGFSSIDADSVAFYEPGAVLIPHVVLPSTIVNVDDDSQVAVPPNPQLRVTLSMAPNPFNPSTRLTFSLPGVGQTKIDAYDIKGHKVAEIWEGWSSGMPLSITWDGKGHDGRSLPSGAYLIRLEGPGGVTGLARGILLK